MKCQHRLPSASKNKGFCLMVIYILNWFLRVYIDEGKGVKPSFLFVTVFMYPYGN